MKNADYEIANPNRVGTTARPSSLAATVELGADWKIDFRELTGVPPIAVRGQLHRVSAACGLVQGTIGHRGRIVALNQGADFHYTWTIARDNRQLICAGEPGAPARATSARGGADRRDKSLDEACRRTRIVWQLERRLGAKM
jgi:hypothetical protein